MSTSHLKLKLVILFLFICPSVALSEPAAGDSKAEIEVLEKIVQQLDELNRNFSNSQNAQAEHNKEVRAILNEIAGALSSSNRHNVNTVLDLLETIARK